MSNTSVWFYRDPRTGRVPVLRWLARLARRNSLALDRCRARIERLAEYGHRLRRPEADYLEDGVYELRMRQGRVHHRILYFFHGRNTAVLVHALTKEGPVLATDLRRAIERMQAFRSDPSRHRYTEASDA